MKKIIGIVLAVTCAFALFSCGDDGGTPIDNLNAMYKVSAPTKVVTETTEVIGTVTLNGSSTLITGKVNGKAASTYVYSFQQIRSVEEGTDTIEKPWIEISGTQEYIEDKGLRTDGGKWDEEGENFAPVAGSIAIKLSNEDVTNVVEDAENKTISFTVPKDKTAAVFGDMISLPEADEDEAEGGDSAANLINSDVNVVISHDGAVITAAVFTYTVTGEDDKHPEIAVTVKAVYTYDIERITID